MTKLHALRSFSLDALAWRVLRAVLPFVDIYGRDVNETLYLTRWMLSPDTRWGRIYLHRFNRHDNDRDPHDHPFNFFTIPLNTGYREEVFERSSGGCFRMVDVPRLRVTFRPALHRHRVLATHRGDWPLWTLVFRGSNVRKWGFWVYDLPDNPAANVRSWLHWKRYITTVEDFGPDGRDDVCPGFTRPIDDKARSIATKPKPGYVD